MKWKIECWIQAKSSTLPNDDEVFKQRIHFIKVMVTNGWKNPYRTSAPFLQRRAKRKLDFFPILSLLYRASFDCGVPTSSLPAFRAWFRSSLFLSTSRFSLASFLHLQAVFGLWITGCSSFIFALAQPLRKEIFYERFSFFQKSSLFPSCRRFKCL